MKIKHWQGYGSLTAKKMKLKTKNGITDLVVRVSGDHECGLIPGGYHGSDLTDDGWATDILFDWLIKRFDKNLSSSTELDVIIEYVQYMVIPADVETVEYTFRYRMRKEP